MKGYKGMTKDMKCRGMQFEIGKTYRVMGNIELCRNGLHFCKNLKDVFEFYGRDEGSRYFEIEAKDPIISDGVKCVTAELTVLREIPDVLVTRCMYGNGRGGGSGDGSGDGWCDGWVGGSGDGWGDGWCDGRGDGWGDGWCDGRGDGRGDGWCDGRGNDNIQRLLIFRKA